MPKNLNEIFAEWRTFPSEEHEIRLYRALSLFVRKLVILNLHEEPPDLVGDIVSHIFIVEQRDTACFKGDAKFTTWVYRVAARMCWAAARKRKSLNEVNIEEMPPPPQHLSSPALALYDILRHLSIDDKSLLLKKLNGATNAEIAVNLGLSVEGVKSRWARMKLRLLSQNAGKTF